VTKEQSLMARVLEERIKDLDDVIFYITKTWRISLTTKKPKLFLNNIAYGGYEQNTIECDGELRNKIVEVLKEHKQKLEEEYKNL
jgi:hypothetical protein